MKVARPQLRTSSSSGFTLLEVIITLTILVGLTYAISMLIRSSFDIRSGLRESTQTTHRMNVALQSLSNDITHAFLLSSKNSLRTENRRRTIFRVEKSGSGDILSLTTVSHSPMRKNSRESDISYVVYELRDSKKYPGRKHLYRGEFPRVPSRFKDMPPMNILAEHIESFSIEAWRGDDWSKDGWDSTRGDTDNMLPHMVRLSIRAWSQVPAEPGERADEENQGLVSVSTVIYLPYALDFNELKPRNSSFKI